MSQESERHRQLFRMNQFVSVVQPSSVVHTSASTVITKRFRFFYFSRTKTERKCGGRWRDNKWLHASPILQIYIYIRDTCGYAE